MKLKIRRPIKYSDSAGRVHQLMTRVTVSRISIKLFLLWLPSRTDQVPRPTYVIFVCLYLFCFADGYVATNHLWLLAKVSVDDILLQVFIIVHTYIHIYIHTYTHTHTNTHKVLPREYYSRHLLISSYHKSDQQISTFY